MNTMYERNLRLSELYDEKVRLVWRSWDGENVDHLIESKQNQINNFVYSTDHLIDNNPDKLKNFEEYGDLFTSEDWAQYVREGSFIPSDGCGNLATKV